MGARTRGAADLNNLFQLRIARTDRQLLSARVASATALDGKLIQEFGQEPDE